MVLQVPDMDHNKIMLGFIVRRCAVELEHQPSPAEFAEWANNQAGEKGRYHLFGCPITNDEAAVILGNPSRLVSIRDSSLGRRRNSHYVCPVALQGRTGSISRSGEAESTARGKVTPLRLP
jgi:hypothetical protein